MEDTLMMPENDFPNTRICYMYRDAYNCKYWDSVVLVGQISLAQKQAILATLDSGEYFVPSLVGLEDLQPETHSPHNHKWHELNMLDFQFTDRRATTETSLEELVQAFVDADWNSVDWVDGEGLVGSDLIKALVENLPLDVRDELQTAYAKYGPQEFLRIIADNVDKFEDEEEICPVQQLAAHIQELIGQYLTEN